MHFGSQEGTLAHFFNKWATRGGNHPHGPPPLVHTTGYTQPLRPKCKSVKVGYEYGVSFPVCATVLGTVVFFSKYYSNWSKHCICIGNYLINYSGTVQFLEVKGTGK